jgi:voltage-gated potassium channel
VFKKQKKVLSAVATMAVSYILISALVIYNVEPESFNTFFDAIYWATISLTTVGYGDIYPITAIGRAVTMVSSIFGIAIIALPSGVITAGYIEEFNNKD